MCSGTPRRDATHRKDRQFLTPQLPSPTLAAPTVSTTLSLAGRTMEKDDDINRNNNHNNPSTTTTLTTTTPQVPELPVVMWRDILELLGVDAKDASLVSRQLHAAWKLGLLEMHLSPSDFDRLTFLGSHGFPGYLSPCTHSISAQEAEATPQRPRTSLTASDASPRPGQCLGALLARSPYLTRFDGFDRQSENFEQALAQEIGLLELNGQPSVNQGNTGMG